MFTEGEEMYLQGKVDARIQLSSPHLGKENLAMFVFREGGISLASGLQCSQMLPHQLVLISQAIDILAVSP